MEHLASIHRKLTFRIIIAVLAISSVLTVVVLIIWFNDIDAKSAGHARAAGNQLRTSIANILDSSGLKDRAQIQRAIEKFFLTSKGTPEGHFVFARVMDGEFREVARISDPGFAQIRIIDKLVASATDYTTLRKIGDLVIKPLTIEDTALVYIGRVLVNSSGTRMGYIEGVFFINPELITRLRQTAILTAIIVAGIVIVISAIFYPTINSLFKRVSTLADGLLHANVEILVVLGSAIAKRDSDTDIHNFRVTLYAIHIGREIGIDDNEMQSLIKGSFLHDVGKIGIKDSILLKPGKLTHDEYDEMKLHVQHGLDIVSRSEWLYDAVPVVGNHHEKFDGSGYLTGMKGTHIPRVARIFAIADVFDALTSKRPYKEPMGLETSIKILLEGRDSHFDPEILDTFITIAPSLYESYANVDDTRIRDDLMKLGRPYFNPGEVYHNKD